VNENDLIKELREGNRAAFEELFDRFSTLVYNVAYRMLQNKQDAEDIPQRGGRACWNYSWNPRGDFRAHRNLVGSEHFSRLGCTRFRFFTACRVVLWRLSCTTRISPRPDYGAPE